MKNITIPEPCSEDWNKMTPTEKGAFCKKCAIDVYDFTGKTSNEIKEILTVNIGSRVCGHIGESQLEQLNTDFSAWQMNDKQSFQRAWVFTLFVVFGLTLFSCKSDEEAFLGEFQETGQEILKNTEPSDSLDVEAIRGEVCVTPIEDETEEGSTVPNELGFVPMMKGQMVYHVEEEPIVNEKEVPLVDPRVNEEVIIDGGMMWSEDFETHLIETADHKGANEIPDANISGLVYPNPASNQTTLQVNMPKKSKGEIKLFALNGQEIRTIHSGRIKKGESQYPIDLTDLETGLYLVVISSGNMKETVKFSKL